MMIVKTEELTQNGILDEVINGLNQEQKQLPTKLFYDEKGSALFNEICELEEYYPTRTEMQIMQDNIEEIGSLLGEGTLLIEFGSGSSTKIRLLLEHIPGLAGYVPMDISAELLIQSAELLRKDYPGLNIYPLAADYTKDFDLPFIEQPYDHIAAYYPGSTIGNFKPNEARIFLKRVAKIIGKNGGMLIGVDLKKDRKTLEAAYNDAKGITAEFNLNILTHINNKLYSNFDANKFRHFAFYNEKESRIEMHLLSNKEQKVRLNGFSLHIKKDENILTEYSYKYSVEEFAQLVSDIFEVRKIWTDKNNFFSIQYLRVK
jgi:dimethylhistidine N-methyltransferase